MTVGAVRQRLVSRTTEDNSDPSEEGKKSLEDLFPCGKVVIHHEPITPEKSSPFLGTLAALSFVIVFVGSLASWPLVVVLVVTSHHWHASVFAFLCCCCYVLPVKRSSFAADFYNFYLSRYFRCTTLAYEQWPPPAACKRSGYSVDGRKDYDDEVDDNNNNNNNNNNTPPTAIYCVHPHGVFALGWSLLFTREELSHVTFCFSNLLCWSPFFRFLSKLTGNPGCIDRQTLKSLLSSQRSIALIPGGYEEAAIHCYEQDRLFLRDRRGFVKYALEYGASLVPVFSFGERSTYFNPQLALRLRAVIAALGVPMVFPWGCSAVPCLPRPTSLHIVVGKEMQMPFIPKPTPEDVEKHHAVYVDRVEQLYHKYKSVFYEEEARLEIW